MCGTEVRDQPSSARSVARVLRPRAAESVVWAGEAVEGLAGAAFGDFRAAGAHPRGGQVRPGPGEPLFQVAVQFLNALFGRDDL